MKSYGMSLVETVVALLLVSLLAAALSTSTGAALRREIDARRRERAAELAAAGLERLLAESPEALAPRHETETIVAGGEVYTRERTIEAGPSAGLWRLTAVARANRGGAPVQVATLRRAAWRIP